MGRNMHSASLVYGADLTVTSAQGIYEGDLRATYTNKLLTKLTGSQTAANVIELALGGGLAYGSSKLGSALDELKQIKNTNVEELLEQGADVYFDPVAKDYIYRRSPELGNSSTISELIETGHIPGVEGVILNDRTVRFGDLYKLATKNGRAIEFSLTKEVIDGKRQFVLYSGGQYTSPFSRTGRTIAHVHPNEIPNQKYPSLGDMKLLNKWYFNQTLNNPSFKAPPHRIIWGSGNIQNTIVYPGIGKEYSIVESLKGLSYVFD